MERVGRLRRLAANFRQLARIDNTPAIRRRLIALATQCDKLAKTIDETQHLSMDRAPLPTRRAISKAGIE